MFGDNDLAGAAEHFKRALALDPADPTVLRDSALLLATLGRLDEALALEEAVVRRDPVNVDALYNLGRHQRMAGRFDAAIASFRTVLSLAPGRGWRARRTRRGAAAEGRCAGRAGGDRAGDERDVEDDRPADGVPRARAQGRLGCRAGRADREVREGRVLQHRLRLRLPRRGGQGVRSGSTRRSSTATAGLGEIVTENLFDKIHADPRWLPFLRKVGKAPEQLAKIEFNGDAAAGGRRHGERRSESRKPAADREPRENRRLA